MATPKENINKKEDFTLVDPYPMRAGGAPCGHYSYPACGCSTCSFPSPRPRMVYCSPAAYQQVNGQRYQLIVSGYGKSRPFYGY
jgi:hypothetical protein